MKKFIVIGFASLILFACKDPAKDQPQATVGSAVAITAASVVPPTTNAAIGLAVYPVTAQNSKIEWTGSKVTGSHDGSFTGFFGAITLVDGALEKGSVSIDIDTNTLTTDPDKLVTHLKSPDFFDVAKFPKATFVSTGVKAGGEKGATHTITGNLTLHGITKSISFPATVTTAADVVDAKANFAINRKDFDLKYPGKANDLIRDDVVIKLTIHAEKKKS